MRKSTLCQVHVKACLLEAGEGWVIGCNWCNVSVLLVQHNAGSVIPVKSEKKLSSPASQVSPISLPLTHTKWKEKQHWWEWIRSQDDAQEGKRACWQAGGKRRISTVTVPAKWMGQADATTWGSWHSRSVVCLSVLGLCVCLCVCARVGKKQQRQNERDKERMCLCLFVCVSLRACLIRAGSQACFSALQQLNYKTCCNPSCSLINHTAPH